MTHDPNNASETVEALEHLAEENDRVRIGDVLDEFGKRSYGPFLLVPALIELTP
ncbi:MAG: exopolysaccharide biosynthesis protein, partial [Alphaproteobacteria bacterium]|nr:exopolysaccharide biosynthesis protein [Alphaproteobacteria bacterium]